MYIINIYVHVYMSPAAAVEMEAQRGRGNGRTGSSSVPGTPAGVDKLIANNCTQKRIMYTI